MKLLIAIVNFRVADLTIDCLRSLQPEIYDVSQVHVEVCENGTGDGSGVRIQKAIETNGWSPWCSITVLDRNLGFTGGNNAVILPRLLGSSPPDYVLMLNPDTIVRPNAIKALVDFMDQNVKVGIAGSRLEDRDGTAQRSAFRFLSPFGEFEAALRLGIVSKLLARWTVAPPVVNHPIETDWVSGASMLIRRQVFEQVGLLDEGYFTYFEDIDFCFKANKAGWTTWYVPESRVVHLIGQSSGISSRLRRLPPYMLEARRRFFLKNHGALYTAMVDGLTLAGLTLFKLRSLINKKKNWSLPHVLRDHFRHSVFARGFRIPIVRLPPKTK